MYDIVVVGAGWAGCGAALEAAKAGAKVALLERTDMILGTGLVGGIMRNNGRYTAAEEMIAMGGGELFELTDRLARHRNIDFPGHRHASLYDVTKVQRGVEEMLAKAGVEIRYEHRVDKLEIDGDCIRKVITSKGAEIEGKVFVDATGTAGPMKNCIKYGNGCAMCIYRCPTFGGRMSLTELAGLKEITGKKQDGSIGAMSGSCKLLKESLSPELTARLERDGKLVIPIPPDVKHDMDLSFKVCQQYNLKDYMENIVLLDTGLAKLMTPYFPLEQLRKIPGFEKARYADPYSGGIGNSIRFTAMAPRDNTLKVRGISNLFCAGEKVGLLVGHTEAICTGVLAGYNAVRMLRDLAGVELPDSIAVGDAIAFVNRQMATEEGLKYKYTFSGSVYFDRMLQRNLYTIDRTEIKKRVVESGCEGLFNDFTCRILRK